jgi:outer membrane protein OmpA-like peptidoglycan-associated protein
MAKQNVWMSVSDLMTGLMVIFLFIAVAYMIQMKENQNVLTDYVETKTKLHDKLVSEFKNDSKKWDMSIGKDLSMRFNNPTVLFAQGSAQPTEQFQRILGEFIPKYLDILLKDSLRSHIQEIRIEGHTDNVPYPQLHPQPFIANAILSQQRSLAVLMYIKPMFEKYPPEEQRLLEYWFTANGLSYGKALNPEGDYALVSKKDRRIDKEKSRRVEFRIITTGDEVLESFVKKNNP